VSAPTPSVPPTGTARSGPAAWFRFPDPVNEVAARLVAAGVVAMAAAVLAGWWWVLVPLTYGFLARVAAGPRLSPLGLLVTRVVVPRLSIPPRPVPGPPKRFAQGIGAVFSLGASLAHFAFGADLVARVLLAGLVFAAALEAALGFCLGCWLFARLMRLGLIPASVCARCVDVGRPVRPAA
jgi:hypothetical protein